MSEGDKDHEENGSRERDREYGIQRKKEGHKCHPGFGLSKLSFNDGGKLGEQVWVEVMISSWVLDMFLLAC